MNDVERIERALCENNGRSGMGKMVERPGWVQVTDANAKTDYRNLILRSVLETNEADDLDIHADITSRGWGSPPAARERFRRIAEAEFRTLGERATYLATYRGEPAATAGLSFLKHSAHFAGSVVLPEFRGRGIYRAMIEERMRIVRQRNVPIVTNLCRSSTSAPICRKVGFRSIGEMLVFSSATRGSSPRP
ncbi:MAG: GNAT family N-acetyltransferase [Planctomycetota bacterium]|jgi:GNAT superfamily N-acetyltransferase